MMIFQNFKNKHKSRSESWSLGPIVVYIIQGTGKGVFIYMIFIIHVLAALILSQLAVTRVTCRPDHSGSRSVV